MSSQVCVDSGVLLKLVIAEDDSDLAEALWDDWLTHEVEIVGQIPETFQTG